MNHEVTERGGRLEERLREVEKDLERQMLERGFEPAQVELIALTGPLAKLYAEREELRAALEEHVRTASGSDPVSTGRSTGGVLKADRLEPGD